MFILFFLGFVLMVGYIVLIVRTIKAINWSTFASLCSLLKLVFLDLLWCYSQLPLSPSDSGKWWSSKEVFKCKIDFICTIFWRSEQSWCWCSSLLAEVFGMYPDIFFFNMIPVLLETSIWAYRFLFNVYFIVAFFGAISSLTYMFKDCHINFRITLHQAFYLSMGYNNISYNEIFTFFPVVLWNLK